MNEDELRVRDLLKGSPPQPSAPGPFPVEKSASSQPQPFLPQVVVETGGGEKEGGEGGGLPFDPRILIIGIYERRLIAAGVAVAVLALSVLAALLLRSKQWEAWVTILRKREQKEFLVTSNQPIVKLQVYSMPTVLRLVKVNENLAAVIEKAKLKTDPSELSKHISVENPKDTDIIEILVRWSDSKEAVEIANILAQEFLRTVDRLQKLEAIQAYDYLNGQLSSVRERMGRLDAELVKFKAEHSLVKLSDQAGKLIEQVASFDALAEKERLDAEMAATAESLTRREMGLQEDTILASIYVKKPLRTRLVELQTKLAEALAVYTEESAKVKELRDEISRMEVLVRQGLEEQLYEQTLSRNPVLSNLQQALVDKTVEAASREARAKGYAALRDRYREQLLQLPGLESQLANMQQNLDTLRQLEATLAGRVEEVRIIRDSTAAGFSVMQEARPPRYPLPSKSKLIVIAGFVLGCGFGVFAATVLAVLDTALKAQSEVQRALGIPPVGEVPLLPPDQVFISSVARAPLELAEIFRSLATELLSRAKEKEQVVLVTSAARFEGRTSVAQNVARMAAARGIRTCLVEADLRKPDLGYFSPLLGIPTISSGLGAVLRGERTAADVAVRTESDNLAVLPFGEAAGLSPEALGGDRMRMALESLRSLFELVLVDAAPLLGNSEALMLAPRCDAALYILESRALPKAAHKEALAKLATSGLTVMGAVLTKVPPEYAAPWKAGSGRRA